MEWTELTVQTATAGLELLCAELTEAGFDSFAVEDGGEFQEFLETSQEYWDYVDASLAEKMRGLSQVRLYLDARETERRLPALRGLLAELPARYPGSDFGSLRLTVERVPDGDWENAWRRSCRPLPVGDRLLVVPQWMEPENLEGRLPVYLDLGLTFGTGEHASTQLCMRALEGLIHGGEHVADLGSGSGILSISALRLGAADAVAIDVDPAAAHISRDNAAHNGYDGTRFRAYTGDVLTDAALTDALCAYDVVCANIVAGVIVRLAPIVPRLLQPDGVFLCSGILADREDEVCRAFAQAGLTVISRARQDEWRCLTAKRKGV